MNATSLAASDLNLNSLIAQLAILTSSQPQAPTEENLRALCDLLYAASLLKEEGRAVRARIVLAPPEAFPVETGPPEGIHAVRFTLPHELNGNEIKRLSPAASFFHSAIAVWPVRDKGLRIWGLLNTGPRWLNLVAGGRKPISGHLPYPIIHVRDPGWIFFYHGYDLIAEWRGRELHGPRLDVFQTRLLNERFVDLRMALIRDLEGKCLPSSLSIDVYLELSHLIGMQFLKRVINLVRSSGHGGTVVMIPEPIEGKNVAERWIDCKYTASPGESGLRFRDLLQGIIRRVGQLCPPGASTEDAWKVFRNSNDADLDELEEAFFELARFFSDLMQVDGALVLDKRICLVGFAGEIRVDHTVLQVDVAHDLEGQRVTPWNVRCDGTRHRSVYRLCSVEPKVIGFVISQDSQVRMIANQNGNVIFWPHTVV